MPEILIVDDDVPWQKTFQLLVSDLGLSPVIAAGYGEALAALRNDRFALAIIDLNLSGLAENKNLDGRDLVAEARRMRLPVIVATGYGTKALAKEIIDAYGVFGYFDKQSFNSDRFLECVKKALAERAVDKTSGQKQSEGKPPTNAGQTWFGSFGQHVVGVVDAVIGAFVFALLAYVVSGITGWFPVYQALYAVSTFFVVIVVSIAYVVWRGKTR